MPAHRPPAVGALLPRPRLAPFANRTLPADGREGRAVDSRIRGFILQP